MALQLGGLTGFGSAELAQLQYDISEVNRALAADSFKAAILAATFENTADTPPQIWDKISGPITLAQETLTYLGFWATHASHTIAEEDEDGEVTCNRPLYDTESSAARSNTQFHESCHVVGYSHRSPTDSLSVPYQAGNLLEAWLIANPRTLSSTDTNGDKKGVSK